MAPSAEDATSNQRLVVGSESLRVFGPNTSARRIYEAAGFVVEGVLREEFRIGEAWVDDVIMARRVDA